MCGCTRIDELTGHLAEQESVLSRLEIIQETMTDPVRGRGGRGTRGRGGFMAGNPVEALGPGAEEAESRFVEAPVRGAAGAAVFARAKGGGGSRVRGKGGSRPPMDTHVRSGSLARGRVRGAPNLGAIAHSFSDNRVLFQPLTMVSTARVDPCARTDCGREPRSEWGGDVQTPVVQEGPLHRVDDGRRCCRRGCRDHGTDVDGGSGLIRVSASPQPRATAL